MSRADWTKIECDGRAYFFLPEPMYAEAVALLRSAGITIAAEGD
jgi:hypothetical protein